MSNSSPEQRNPYLGSPARAWLVLRLTAQDGESREIKLVADTACPVSFIVAPHAVPQCSFGVTSPVITNWGLLQGQWFQLAMPELGLDALMVGFVSEQIADAMESDHPDFVGLAGLPLLRLLEYGGNRTGFWIRRLT